MATRTAAVVSSLLLIGVCAAPSAAQQPPRIINGRVTSQVTDNQSDKRAFSGILALQLHAGPPMTVQFRNIRIRPLKPASGSTKPSSP